MIQKRNFTTFLLLSFVTCGIYGLFFWYKWNEDVNLLCHGDGEKDMDYIIVLLLSIITCGIYGYIWIFRQQNRLYYMAQAKGELKVDSGSTVLLWLIAGVLIGIGPFVSSYQMINALNILAVQDNNANNYYN